MCLCRLLHKHVCAHLHASTAIWNTFLFYRDFTKSLISSADSDALKSSLASTPTVSSNFEACSFFSFQCTSTAFLVSALHYDNVKCYSWYMLKEWKLWLNGAVALAALVTHNFHLCEVSVRPNLNLQHIVFSRDYGNS